MAVLLFHHPNNGVLILVSGYESGDTAVSYLNPMHNFWCPLYLSKAHSQPILSLDVSPDKTFFLTSSADANIAKHPVPHASFELGIETVALREEVPSKLLKTGHSGQQSLRIRNDGKIFATAGWDGRVRVYGVKTMKELAVLKWHKEGCYAVAFAKVGTGEGTEGQSSNEDGKEVTEQTKRLTVRAQRELRSQHGHWLAVGSKDAKVSLWGLY